MTDPEVLERLAARRAELDGLEEQLVKQLAEVRSERDELAVAERVLLRMAEQIAAERDTASSPVVHVAGRAVRLVPDRAPGVAESAQPAEYRRARRCRRSGQSPRSARSKMAKLQWGYGERPVEQALGGGSGGCGPPHCR